MDYSDYLTVVEVAEKWSLSERRVRKFCQNKRVRGVKKVGGMYFIPYQAEKPVDLRIYRGLNKDRRKEKLFQKLDSYRSDVYKKVDILPLQIFEDNFVASLIYDLLTIEGGHSRLRDIEYALKDLSDMMFSMREDEIILKYKRVIEYICVSAEKHTGNKAISFGFVRGVHHMLTGMPINDSIRSHNEERDIVRKFCNMVNNYRVSEQHPIEKSVIFFLDFMTLRAFKDNHFSVPILFFNFLLMRSGYPMINLEFSNPDIFMKYWMPYVKNNNLDPLLQYVARQIGKRINHHRHLTDRLRRL